ncbi:MAG: LapA family protein [Ornithinimicrobium sp.]
MFAVGLILVVLALIVILYVIFATGGLEPMSIDWGIFTADLTPLQLFFLGAATIVVMAIGVAMLSIGLKKQGEKRAEVKRLRKEVKKVQSEQPGGDSADSHQSAQSTKARDEASEDKMANSSSNSAPRGSNDATRQMGTRSASSGSTGQVQSRRAGSGSTPVSDSGSSSSGPSNSGPGNSGSHGSSESGSTPPPPRR